MNYYSTGACVIVSQIEYVSQIVVMQDKAEQDGLGLSIEARSLHPPHPPNPLTHTQVLAANTAVYNAVRRRFVSLCARLLPALELDLAAPFGCASRGVMVRFRRQQRDRRDGGSGNFTNDIKSDGMNVGARDSWSDELGQLSGALPSGLYGSINAGLSFTGFRLTCLFSGYILLT